MTCLMISGILCTLGVRRDGSWDVQGNGALETLQCGGKDNVYKKERPLGVQTRGWVILSKLCAWCAGLVF